MRLEELKQKLHLQSGYVPTLVEWAEAVGTSCHVLQSRLHLGMKSREKMIYANLRLVVYIAKNYQGMGISLQDLLQVLLKILPAVDISTNSLLTSLW